MGVVGSCAFLGLIGTALAVRWLCWPPFDSSFVFGSLLDEQKGGKCSIRPVVADFTSYYNIGHSEELERYFHFIANISTKVEGKYQPLYGIGGQTHLVEKELPRAGYLGNQPVRIGNDAYTHNDACGQVLVVLLPLYIDCRFQDPGRPTPLALVTEALRLIETTMDQPDFPRLSWALSIEDDGLVVVHEYLLVQH